MPGSLEPKGCSKKRLQQQPPLHSYKIKSALGFSMIMSQSSRLPEAHNTRAQTWISTVIAHSGVD